MKRGRRGQSLVESALVLAAFLGLVLGIVDVGQLLFERQTLAERVHQAARWGAMHPYDTRAIRNVVLYGTPQPGIEAIPVLGLASDAVQVANPGCPGTDCRISVAITGRGVRSVEPVE
jgi:hypothetical protein